MGEKLGTLCPMLYLEENWVLSRKGTHEEGMKVVRNLKEVADYLRKTKPFLL